MLFGAFLGDSCACTTCVYEGSRLLVELLYRRVCAPNHMVSEVELSLVAYLRTFHTLLLSSLHSWNLEKGEEESCETSEDLSSFSRWSPKASWTAEVWGRVGLDSTKAALSGRTSLLWLPGYSGCQGSFAFVAVLNELHFYVFSWD